MDQTHKEDTSAVVSIIVPVFNRPDETKELLESISLQNYRDDIEVLIVEDGSTVTCEEVVSLYSEQLSMRYVRQDNAGPAEARNNGARRARGRYLYFLDSDCTLPANFLSVLKTYVGESGVQCFGTRDSAHVFFTPMQKAISYSMTSLFTTGGIRGKAGKKMDTFYPRSYSMGVLKSAFDAVDGFSDMRYGEDVDLSMRLRESGYELGLMGDTFVYHKRRTTLKSFFKQTFCSGTARIDLALRHTGALKLVHLLPSVAVVCLVALLVLSVVVLPLFLLPLLLYGLLIFVDSYREFGNLRVAVLSIATSATQILGYGLGFFYNAVVRLVLKNKEHVAFVKTLYKP